MFLKNLITNILFVSIAFSPTLILNAFIQPYSRGFYCDDLTIRKPKLDYEKVPTALLLFLATIPPVLIICIVDWLSHNYHKCRDLQHSALKLSLSDVFNFSYGIALLMVMVDTTKYTIGRHRPNFYESCEPRIPIFDQNNVKSYVECTTTRLNFKYITNYECTKKEVTKDIHLSFMSGHASSMAYCSVFVSILLIQRLKKLLKSTLGRALVALVIILEIDLALFVGYTRVSDYKHHPTDVLTGFAFGAAMAVFARLFLNRSKCSVYDTDRIQNLQLNFKRDQPVPTSSLGDMV